MVMKLVMVSILFLLVLGMAGSPQSNTLQSNTVSTPSVHFNTSPTLTWYNQTPYEYSASISAPYNWTLKTNASLHMSDGNTANNTASQSIYGVLSTGYYWVNVSISYHNATGVFIQLIHQNFTLHIVNKPYIYSTPETFFYPFSTYNYTYSINQGNITAYSSGFTLNKTSRTLSEYLMGSSYSFYLTVSDKNGTYTQYWGVASSDLTNMSFVATIGTGEVTITAPLSGIGVTNTTVFLSGNPVFISDGLTHPYWLTINNNTYYTLSTDSNTTQPATMYFNSLISGTFYNMYMVYNNGGSEKLLKTVTVDSSGTVSFTYDPSNMPLDPVFELLPYTYTSHVTPPQKQAPFNYTPFLMISVAFLMAVFVFYYFSKSKSGGKGGRYGSKRI